MDFVTPELISQAATHVLLICLHPVVDNRFVTVVYFRDFDYQTVDHNFLLPWFEWPSLMSLE